MTVLQLGRFSKLIGEENVLRYHWDLHKFITTKLLYINLLLKRLRAAGLFCLQKIQLLHLEEPT